MTIADELPKRLTDMYEVRAAANGFVVTPGHHMMRNGYTDMADVTVFSDWASCSKWLGDQFRALREPS